MFEINMKLYLIIGISIVLFIIFFLYYAIYIQESFEAVKFMSDIETALFLKEDKDGYLKGLSKPDLHARHVKNVNEYIDKITQSALSFTEAEKMRLSRCLIDADIFLKTYVYSNALDCKELIAIPWKIALTHNHVYEEGFPHTRGDVIFLSTFTLQEIDHDLTATLIHEKVHIYQRQNPKKMKYLLDKMGYKEMHINAHRLQRANPDLNDKTYYYTKTNKIMMFLYKSDRPEHINDIQTSEHASNEHPYEKIAYDIADAYTKHYLQNMMKVL
jgi:hypothetical protein